jgi:serine/threonine protein kinase
MATQQNCALPPGFLLDHYRVERQLSLGGSIVYLAYDQDGTPVAIKEYLPNSRPAREGEVTPHVTEAHQGAFRYGMKCFFEEGRALAKLVHPNVVRVLNFFRANGTVYMVMQFERGRTLHDYVQKNKGNVRERFIRGVFTRMLNGLREVHAHKLLHLDIKPSNIYLRADGTPVLLDFGAARQTLLSDTPILKPMYTPASPRPSSSQPRSPRPVERHLQRGRQHVRLPGRALAAALRRARQARHRGPGHQGLGRAVFAPLPRHHRLVPSARPAEAPAKLFRPAESLAQRHREAPPQQKTWLEGLGSRLKTMIGRT